MLTAVLAVTFLAFVLAVLAFGYAGRKESLKLILATGLTMSAVTAVAVIVVTALHRCDGCVRDKRRKEG